MLHLKILFILLFSIFAYAKPIIINEQTNQINILENSKLFIDDSQKLKIVDIKNKVFVQNEKPLLGYGYDPKINVWVKFKIKNESDSKIEKIVEYSNSLTTHLEFYCPDNGYKEAQEEGLFNILEDRKTIKPIFKISLEANETKTYYLKASSDITTLIVKLTLFNEEVFYKNELLHQSILSLFFGAMFILAFYNIFIYFFTRDISYLYYVLYIFSISLHHTIYTGICNVYFPQWFIIKSIEYSAFIVAIPIFTLALFTKYFLQTKKLKKHDYILNIFLFVIPISLLFFTLTDGYEKYRNILTLLLMIYLIYITIYSALKRNRQAYFILAGWFLIFIAVLFMVLSSAGAFNVYEYFPYYVEASLLLEAVIFSIALADRINNLQKEKNEMSSKLLLQEQNAKIKLSRKVDERTKDLKEALDEKNLLLKELHHRVKNNMQTIVSLIRLQNDEIDDERLNEILTTIQNRINAMSQLHELLYKQSNLSHINAYEYFEILIEELRDTYDEDVEIHLDIQSNLKMGQAIYCGLILNELITNSFKYAFPNEEHDGNIFVSLKEENEHLILIVKDDGVGFKEKASSSLGLVLVDTLVTRQLRGKIDTKSKNGVETKIIWSNNA